MQNELEEFFTPYKIPQLKNGVRLPDYTVEFSLKKKYDLPPDGINFDFLLKLVQHGFREKVEKRVPKDHWEKYTARINQELEAFKSLGFVDYLLLIWDIINFCRENGIATGYGRGSSGGSLILYLIDVTQIDSIKYGCYFERFLSKTRAKFNEIDGVRYYDGKLLMDVDLDITPTERGKIAKYLANKYPGRVAKLPNASTLTTKVLIKEVLKTMYEWSEQDVNAITEMIPVEFGKPLTLQKSIEQSPEFAKFAASYPEVIEAAKKLYLLTRHKSVHASAWIISHDPLDEFIPLELSKKDKELTTSFTMDDALKVVVKVDLLGLKTAAIINDVCKSVGLNMLDIDFNDPMIYDVLQSLETPEGLFQIEADCNYNVLRKVKPRNLTQLGAVLSLGRPGAIEFVDQFAKYVETGEFQSVHPDFDPVLKDTAGCPIFQEDLMRIAHEIFGFTLEQAELLRRAVGKKSHEEMAKFESVLKEKGAQLHREESAAKFWEMLQASADYSFNKSHAMAYACDCAATVYLKFKHPLEFFIAILRLAKIENASIEEYQTIYSELKHFGIQFLPPSLYRSDLDFKIEGKGIRCGLGSIKGIANKGIEKLVNFRRNFENRFQIFKSASETNIPINILASLILSGAMDENKPYAYLERNQLLFEAQVFTKLNEREQVMVLARGEEFKYQLFEVLKFLAKTLNEKGKPLIKPSRMDTIRKHTEKFKLQFRANTANEQHRLFSVWKFEKMLLGQPYSITLQDVFASFDRIHCISTLLGELDDSEVKAVGEISEFIECVSRNGNKQWKFYLSDQSGTMKVYLTSTPKRDRIGNYMENAERKPQNGDIVIVCGTKKESMIFADQVVIQQFNLVLKSTEAEEEQAK